MPKILYMPSHIRKLDIYDWLLMNTLSMRNLTRRICRLKKNVEIMVAKMAKTSLPICGYRKLSNLK
jgi:hypothetical protein